MEKYNALVMVDDSHAIGFVGKTGRGTPEHCGVKGRVDIITGTFGKALGGASGGFTTGHREIIDILRQRSRPYLFSNSLAPAIVETSKKVLDLISNTTKYRDALYNNTIYFINKMNSAGFNINDKGHPIVPIMLYDAVIAQKMAEKLLNEGVYVTGFFYPVVPKGNARIRVQISAAHTKKNIDFAVSAFKKVKNEMAL